jgi:hypothetical protein
MKWYICFDENGKKLWRVKGAQAASKKAGIHPTTLRKHVCYGTPDKNKQTYDIDFDENKV